MADVVEIVADGRPYPVEYKRGKPKRHRADEVQLCAQGICLEEMMDREVPEGSLYYGKNRRRKVVKLDSELRSITKHIAEKTYELLNSQKTPEPEYEERKCDSCSLREICLPRRPTSTQIVTAWIEARINLETDECEGT